MFFLIGGLTALALAASALDGEAATTLAGLIEQFEGSQEASLLLGSLWAWGGSAALAFVVTRLWVSLSAPRHSSWPSATSRSEAPSLGGMGLAARTTASRRGPPLTTSL